MKVVLCKHVLLRANLKDKHLSMSTKLILLSVSLQPLQSFHVVRVLTVWLCFQLFLATSHQQEAHIVSLREVITMYGKKDVQWCMTIHSFLSLILVFSVRLSFLQWPLCWRMITLFGELAYQEDLRQKKWSFTGVPAMDLRALNIASMGDVTLWRYAQSTKSWHIRNEAYLRDSSTFLLIVV